MYNEKTAVNLVTVSRSEHSACAKTFLSVRLAPYDLINVTIYKRTSK